MKNLLTKLRYVPKRFGVIAALVVAGASAALTFAWGPTRTTFTVESPAPYVTFNSITNNPIDGDERNFSRAKDVAGGSAAWTDSVTVEPGKEYIVRMVVHNNAGDNLKLNAVNTRASASVPTTTGKSVTVSNFVSADNANPVKVWDDVAFTSSQDFNLAYVAGSARIYNSGYAAGGSGQPLPDSIVTSGGALLGYEKAGDGIIPGCFKYLSYVEYKVKPQFAAQPDFTIVKDVRKNGTTTYGQTVAVNPGDKVDYRIKFVNTGEVKLDNVTIKDALPAGITYVPGTAKMQNANYVYPNMYSMPDELFTTGANIGHYGPTINAFVTFTGQVAANAQLPVCGENTLKNVASVITGFGGKSDDADVTVTKTCEQPTPTAACTAITANKISRTEFSFDGSATVQNGATVSKYTFVVKNSAGAVIKTVTVNSDALAVNSGTVTLTDTGVYTVVLTVTTSVGDKTAPACQTTVEVKPEDKDIQVCRLSDKTIVTIKESAFDATKYSRNLDDCKPVVVKMIKVCELSTWTVKEIKETDFDATKHSKNLEDCKERVCELSTKTVITINKKDFDETKYSRNLDDCKVLPVTYIKVCELSSSTVITIKESDYDAAKHSRNLDDCEKIRVCERDTKQIVTIRKSDFDAKKHSMEAKDCETVVTPPTTPTELPSTGPEMLVGGLFGSSALGLGISSFVRSRSAVRRALMNR